ncbi:hypothetical protein EKL28_17005, partial [Staphylococcus aureus]
EKVMVIADDEKALAIAGIMGGLSSSVTDATTEINTKAPTPEWIGTCTCTFRYPSAQHFGRHYQLCIDRAGSTVACI